MSHVWVGARCLSRRRGVRPGQGRIGLYADRFTPDTGETRTDTYHRPGDLPAELD